MSRLIDVDKLIKRFEGLRDEHETHSISYNALYEILVQEPTAFDTGKVIEQIHDKYCHKCRNILGKKSSEEYCKSVNCEIDALCNIVKKGGVE